MTCTIALASDHAGFALKEALKEKLTSEGHHVKDLGTHDEESVDYPDFGFDLAHSLQNEEAKWGIAICGSGIGISIAANRLPGVRAALCTSPELATLARQHNDANVLALGSRVIDQETAFACVDAFLGTAFEGGRHIQRVEKLG